MCWGAEWRSNGRIPRLSTLGGFGTSPRTANYIQFNYATTSWEVSQKLSTDQRNAEAALKCPSSVHVLCHLLKANGNKRRERYSSGAGIRIKRNETLITSKLEKMMGISYKKCKSKGQKAQLLLQ